jgi:hypothetical protein
MDESPDPLGGPTLQPNFRQSFSRGFLTSARPRVSTMAARQLHHGETQNSVDLRPPSFRSFVSGR